MAGSSPGRRRRRKAPSTNTISVIVRDSGVPQMSATNSFSVVVYRSNTPPVLSAIPDQTVYRQHLADLHGQRDGHGSAAADPDLQPGDRGAHGRQHHDQRRVLLDADGGPGAEHQHDFGNCDGQRRAPDVGHQQFQCGGLSAQHAAGALGDSQPDGVCQHPADLHGQRDGYGSAAAGLDLQPGLRGAHRREHHDRRRLHLDADGGPGAEHQHHFGDCARTAACPRCRPPTASRWWSIGQTRRRCMGAISDQAVYANTLLTFTVSATDTDQPPQTLTFSLGAGAPTGASITTGGVFTWTPTAAQAPSTNTLSVIVTDNGLPAMSATNSFKVVVYRPNTPPVHGRDHRPGRLCQHAADLHRQRDGHGSAAADPDLQPGRRGADGREHHVRRRVHLDADGGAGAEHEHDLGDRARTAGARQMSATNSFKVVVYRPNTAAGHGRHSDQTVYANTLLTFTVSATDTDQPPQTLTFSLGAGRRPGRALPLAACSPGRRRRRRRPSTNTISVIVHGQRRAADVGHQQLQGGGVSAQHRAGHRAPSPTRRFMPTRC